MRLSLLFAAALCVLLCLTSPAGSQTKSPAKSPETPAAKSTKSDSSRADSTKDPEVERMARERRLQAQSLLLALAADAANYTEQQLRARTLARIADVLWDSDPDRGRALFRKAWDAAEIADEESRRQQQDEIQRQRAQNSGQPTVIGGRPDLRNEVLRLAARRDRAMGEEFLTKFKTEKQQELSNATDRLPTSPYDAPEAVAQRLNLARQLLDTDVARAIQFADPALGSVTREGLDFLSYLRDHDAVAADQRYARMLASAANLQSDCNTVSILSSYLFTPHMFVTFSDNGASTTQTGRNSGPPQVAPELRLAFFRVAAEILLRPLPPPGQDQSSSGVQAKYLMLKRLLPLFEQFAPRETTEVIRAQMEALANAVPEDTRTRDDDRLREGIRPPLTGEDREKALLDRLDRAKTSEERDQIYSDLARLLCDSGDTRARDYAAKIEDSETRTKVRAFVDGTLVMRAIDKKDVDRILDLARNGDLTHLQRAWALTQAARFIGNKEQEKAVAVLDEAATEARRLEPTDPDRPRALFAIASAMLVIDRSKGWDAVYEGAKAANMAESFTGEDGVMRVSLITKGTSSIRSSSVRDFDVGPIFSDLAAEDYNRAVELARLFDHEGPRASATIAIARSVLEERKK